MIIYFVCFLVYIDELDNKHFAPSDISKIGEKYEEKIFENLLFPKTNQRSFQFSWIKKYPWIEYSVKRDAVFCYPCRQFPTTSTSKNPDATFTVSGFRNWSSALQTKKGFPLHERSTYHISAAASMHEKFARESQKIEITQLLSGNVLSLRRHYVKSILDVVIFLASNELAFRGNWDMDSKAENGLFQSLFKFGMKKDETLQKAIKIIPKNALYTCPEIQNQMIASAVFCLRQAIVEKVNLSDYFTLFVDGTKDRNGVECLSIGVRYILDGKPYESVLGMELCEDLSAYGISIVILESLKSYGVNTDKMLSQCYDGAFVMSGHQGGVQTILQEHFKRFIPYVHCFSHRLHLVIIEAVKNINLVDIFFNQTKMIHNFFKLYKVKKYYEGTPLKKLITTRWEGHLKSTTAIFENYKEIVVCLREIVVKGCGLSTEDIAKATGILACISKTQFIYIMLYMKDLLEIIRPADKILQSREIGYVDALPVIQSVLKKVENLQSDEEYNILEEKAVQFISEAEVQVQPRKNRPRSCSAGVAVEHQEGEGEGQNNSIRVAYFKVLDIIISEIKRRFQENSDILLALSAARKMELALLGPLAVLSRIEIPSERELQIAKDYVDRQIQQEIEEIEKLPEEEQKKRKKKSILQHIYPVRVAFENVYKLFCAIDTFACSTAISECSFSCLARVGIVGRVHMTNERLRNLSFLAFEEKEFNKIEPEKVLRHFNGMKNRKLQIF